MNKSEPWSLAWDVGKQIGSGGQGVVRLLSSRVENGRTAVLKNIVEHWKHSPQARERLEQEINTLQLLSKKNAKVPKVFDSHMNYDASEPFLIMEYIEGIQFDKWLESCGTVSIDEAVQVTLAIADTLQICHESDIGHRDLKPANIILRGGDPSDPVVIDFGISFDSKNTYALTKEGEMFWNEFIILPECQDLDGGHRDLRTDLTALAGVFFACLTGQPPRVLRNGVDRAPHQRHEKSVRNAGRTSSEGEQLLWFFSRAFEQHIERRFQTLEELRAELQSFLEAQETRKFDLSDSFNLLGSVIVNRDPEVQLSLLKSKFETYGTEIINNAIETINKRIRPDGIAKSKNLELIKLQDADLPQVGGLKALSVHAKGIYISRNHFKRVAAAFLLGIGEGKKMHLYVAGSTARSTEFLKFDMHLEWVKIVVVEDAHLSMSKIQKDVVNEAISNQLGFGLAKLAREADQAELESPNSEAT